MIWNCETTHQWGFDVASGHLDAETRASWDLHAQQCLVCRREVDVLGDMLGRRREPDAPEEILRDVFVALRPEIDCATRPPKRDNRRFVWPVFFALLGSAALLVFFSLQVDPEASVAQVVRVANRSLSWDPTESAYLLTGIGVGDRVVTASEEVIGVTFHGDDLMLHEDSVLRVTEFTMARTILELEAGVLSVHARRAAGKRVFVVEAPFGTVSVHGTVFRVDAVNGRVSVAEGVVSVRPPTQEEAVELRPGQMLDVKAGVVQEDAPKELSAQFEGGWWSLQKNERTQFGWVRIAERSGDASIILDGVDVGSSSQLLRWPVGTVEYVVNFGDRQERGRLVVQPNRMSEFPSSVLSIDPTSNRVNSRADRELDEENDEESAIVKRGRRKSARINTSRRRAATRISRKLPGAFSQALSSARCNDAHQMVTKLTSMEPADTSETLNLVAECHLAHNQRHRALAVYQQVYLRFADTPAAETALFEIGRLSEQLGDRETAKQSFQNYIARYKNGVLHGDAIFRLCVLQIGDKQYEAAKQCLERYRDSHERGERVGESFVLQAKLEKDINNNWRAAAALYRKAYEHDGRERGEIAAYWWVMCLRNVDPNEFAAAAQKYLRDFSRGEHAAEIREWLRR